MQFGFPLGVPLQGGRCCSYHGVCRPHGLFFSWWGGRWGQFLIMSVSTTFRKHGGRTNFKYLFDHYFSESVFMSVNRTKEVFLACSYEVYRRHSF